MTRKQKPLAIRWEIVYRDSLGDYHRATGTETYGAEYVEFYRKGESISCHRVLVTHLVRSIDWTNEQKVLGGLSSRRIKPMSVRY